MPLTIYPYLMGCIWVFDDERTGLKEEAFVLGMTEMISRLVETKELVDPGAGFALTFSAEPFPEADAELHWLRADESISIMQGNWYRGEIAGEVMEGWLCPALGLYFKSAPPRIFVQAAPLPPGIDPIWHVPADDSRARRFMSTDDA